MKCGVLIGTLVVAALSATGGNAEHTVRPRVGFVSYSGTEPSPRTIEGVALAGFVRAERKLPIRGQVRYVGPTQGPRAVLESFARQNYDLVVAPLFNAEAVVPVSRRFPHVQFVVVDAQPPEQHAKNIHRAVFRAEEAGYLAGYLSALMADRAGGRRMISVVGGYRFYGVTRWIVGYRAGAKKANPRMTLRVDYSNDFANPAKCRRVALSQIAAGSKVVFNIAGACGVGALRAASSKKVWGVGVDIDQSFVGPWILTSAVARYDRGVFDTVRRRVLGNLGAGSTSVYAVRNGGVELGRISPKVPKGFLRKLERIRKQIANGTIKVPHPRG